MKTVLSVETKKMGTLAIEVADDFRECHIEGFGKADISYHTFDFKSMGINYISVNRHTETAHKIAESLIQKGLEGIALNMWPVEYGKARYGQSSGVMASYKENDDEGHYEGDFDILPFLLELTEEHKQQIKDAFMLYCEGFENKIVSGEISVIKNGNYLYFRDKDGNEGGEKISNGFQERYGLCDTFLSMSDDLRAIKDGDVSIFVLQKIEKEKEKIRAKEEAKAKLYANVTRVEKSKPKTFNDDGDYEVVVKVYMKSGNIHQFSCRNIEGLGLAINPQGGGLAINIENFIQTNKSSFENPEYAQAFRDQNPTHTGWVWSLYNKPSRPIEAEELEAYLVCKAETRGFTEMRM